MDGFELFDHTTIHDQSSVISYQLSSSFVQSSILKADFHTVEFSDWIGNPLFTFENVALNLNRLLRVTNVLLLPCQIQSSR